MKDVILYALDMKIINDTEKKNAKDLLARLKDIKLKCFREKEKYNFYDGLLLAIDVLKDRIKTYESLTNTNFRLDTFNRYVKENNLNNAEIKTLSDRVFNLNY